MLQITNEQNSDTDDDGCQRERGREECQLGKMVEYMIIEENWTFMF